MVKEYPIAIGRKGAGKQKKGDHKTPLGEYALGQPRTSKRYGIFIPVGYPTSQQALKGFSGSGVGVHGPHRQFKQLGELHNGADWTLGCIALWNDEDIWDVADWVKSNHVNTIVIK